MNDSRTQTPEAICNPCKHCPIRDTGTCDLGLQAGEHLTTLTPDSFGTSRAREKICRKGEPSPDALILCRGWAYRFDVLPDGRRQILDFLLPGDLISICAPFRNEHSGTVQTLTKTMFGRLNRKSLQSKILSEPRYLMRIAKSCIDDIDRLEGTLGDLGRRSAIERVARLILGLIRRLEERDMLTDMACEFPVRQEHIADATGLTPIHVGRMLRQMRDEGVIDIRKGWLRVIDESTLQRIAEHTH